MGRLFTTIALLRPGNRTAGTLGAVESGASLGGALADLRGAKAAEAASRAALRAAIDSNEQHRREHAEQQARVLAGYPKGVPGSRYND